MPNAETLIVLAIVFALGFGTFLFGFLLGWKFGRESVSQPMFNFTPTPSPQKDETLDERTPWDVAQADNEEHLS